MITASQTMIGRAIGHNHERRGLAIMAVGAIVVLLSLVLAPLATRVLNPPPSPAHTSHP
jgi:hypothetical protein